MKNKRAQGAPFLLIQPLSAMTTMSVQRTAATWKPGHVFIRTIRMYAMTASIARSEMPVLTEAVSLEIPVTAPMVLLVLKTAAMRMRTGVSM